MSFCDQDFAFFCDESGITTERYLVVGGLAMRREVIPDLQTKIQQFRQVHGLSKELKWTRVSDHKLSEYREFFRIFLQFLHAGHCQFHCLIFDSHQWQHHRYNNGDRDVGLSKLYFQLLHHKFGKDYGAAGTLFVRMDHRNSSTSLEDLRRMLNAAAARDHGLRSNPFKVIQSEDSKACDILQLNDLVLGAVCSARNGRHLETEGRQSKKELARLVLRTSGLSSFEYNTSFSERDFTVWNMRPRIS